MGAKPLAKASLISTLILVFAVSAQQTAAADAGQPKAAEAAQEQQEASPRVEVNQFLEAVRTGKDGLAAEYLELTRKNLNNGAELAGQLAPVLQGDPAFDVETLSSDPAGSLGDGLPPNQEDIAHLLVGGPGGTQPVRMTRQGAALFLTAVLAWVVGFLAGRVLNRLEATLVKRTRTTLDDEIGSKLQGPITLACSLAVAGAIRPMLDLPESTGNTLFHLIRGGYLAVVYWLCMRGVDLVREVISRSPVAMSQPASRSLISLGSRFTKALLFVILVIAVLSQLGFPVASLLAGLGIGGLAVALAGQKTLENLAMVDTTSNDEFNLLRQTVLRQTLRALTELGVRVQPTLASVPQARVA